MLNVLHVAKLLFNNYFPRLSNNTGFPSVLEGRHTVRKREKPQRKCSISDDAIPRNETCRFLGQRHPTYCHRTKDSKRVIRIQQETFQVSQAAPNVYCCFLVTLNKSDVRRIGQARGLAALFTRCARSGESSSENDVSQPAFYL